MKAIGVFPKDHSVRVVDEPEPEMTSPSSVKLRILEVGVCGTDKEIMRFEYGEPPHGSDHLVLGHESLGELVETAAGVSTLKKGDLAVLMVRRPCPHPECTACRNGRQDFCFTGDFTERGIKQASGFMAVHVVDEERYIVPVPEDLRQIAVLTEPLTIAEKAFTQMFEIQERLPWLAPAAGSEPALSGRKGLILGAGPVGLLGAMKLVLSGCETFVYSREPEEGDRAELVRALGARYLSSEKTGPCDLANATGGIDVVYEATGASALAFDVLQQLDANAIFMFTGVPGRKYPVNVPTGDLMRRLVLQNQVLLGTVNAGRDAFSAAVADLRLFRERFGNAVSRLITRHIAMDEFPKVDWQTVGGVKTVVDIG